MKTLFQLSYMFALSLLTHTYGDLQTHPLQDPLPDSTSNDWIQEPKGHLFDTTRCNIDRLPWSTPFHVFREKYFLQKPVIFYMDSDELREELNKTRIVWSRDNIIKDYGNRTVSLGSAHSLTAYGEGVMEMTLEDYIADMKNISGVSHTHYLFDRFHFLRSAPILRDSYLNIHHYFFDYRFQPAIYDDTIAIAIGPSGSGISHHWHKDGWNQVISGRKRWFLYPPSVGVPPFGYNQFEPVSVWYLKHYHQLKDSELPLECMQYEGEMFYVPESFFHATINVGETVAVLGQTRTPQVGTQQFLISEGLEAPTKEKALPYFMSALRMGGGKHSQVYNNLANLYNIFGEKEKAFESYQAAAKYNPSYAYAWQALGNMLIERQQYDQAFDYFIAANELHGNDYEIMFGVGTCLYKTGKLVPAKEWFERAINLPLKNATGTDASARMNAYVNLAVIYNDLGQYEECLKLFSERIKLFPNENALQLAAATCLRGLHQYGPAESLLGSMLGEAPIAFKLAARELQLLERERTATLPPDHPMRQTAAM